MKDLWQEILLTITRNKWRSLMTAFGVFWGILMLIILVGCGISLNKGMNRNIQGVPSNSIFMCPSRTSIPYKGFRKDRRWTMNNDDVAYVRQQLGKKGRYISSINFAGNYTTNYGSQSGEYQIAGVTPAYYYSTPQKILYGRYINDIDLQERRKVCVIGQKVYDNLFSDQMDPCGRLIKAGNIYYTIVGVVKATSEMTIGIDINQALLLPLPTEQLAYRQHNTVDMLLVTLHDEYDATREQKQIELWVKERHFIHPDDPSAIWAFNLSEMLGSFQALFLGIGILIWIVGAGTLLAGLIGISNIMLVTVKERTQEIGIRRALGAKPFSILSQIMAESILLTGAAGICGLLLGVWILAAIGSGLESNPSEDSMFMAPQIPFSVGLIALTILVAGGLLAGWMPARRAMKIKAIEALRDE